MTESDSFTEVAPFYDELMRDVPYRSWVRYLQQLLEARRAKPKRVLDLACGTGNVSLLLAERGYEVVGVDLSPGMIAEAQRKAARHSYAAEFHVQDAALLNLPRQRFDLCVSFFDSLNYITDPAALESAIQGVFLHLRPGGLFVFDVNSEYALENGFFEQDHTDCEDRLRYVWRSEYDADTRICRVHMRFFRRGNDDVDHEFREVHVQYAYSEEQLREMLERAGFRQIETFHAYTLHPVRPTTDRIFFAAQRP